MDSITNQTFSEHLVAIFINLVVTSGNLKLQYHLYKLGNLTLSKIKSSEHQVKSSSSYALQGLFQMYVQEFVLFQQAVVKIQGHALSFGSFINSGETDATSMLLIRTLSCNRRR